MSIVVVAGAIANKPHNSGNAWEKMSWVTGLRQLGFEVWFIEQIAPAAYIESQKVVAGIAASTNAAWLRLVVDWFGVGSRYALISPEGISHSGASSEKLLDIADAADLLVNISGHLTLDPLLRRFRRKAFIDVDPGYTQFWHADPATKYSIADHDYFFTIGENIGTSHCSIPTGGIPWRPIRQPVVLADWPLATTANRSRFTTIGSWRGAYGAVPYAGRTYGQKMHEFRKFVLLPTLLRGLQFEAALDIHPADAKDLALLNENGWRIIEPGAIADNPAAFRRYVQESAAEWSVAQGIYVETNSGWFSDRTVRYLASGKPALMQDTGFSRRYPVGTGLVPFRTLDEAVVGAERIMRDYDEHCQAARDIAVYYFDSDKVLGQLMDEIGVSP